MTVHTDLCRRAKIHVDWTLVKKSDYLMALTDELQMPESHILDNFLRPFVRDSALSVRDSAALLRSLPGLGPKK
ncbi:MAG: hypothetical protein FWD68_09820 [Alphaproteobacteria bacterium]|nr:hypothetical protein [Alphaproteobacteria bacterium]